MHSDPTYEYAMLCERQRALEMIADLPSFRRNNSYVKIAGWRKVLRCIDENKRDADRFVGEILEPNDERALREGAVVVQYNSLRVNAKFYKRDRSLAPRSEIFIAVYCVVDGELVKVYWDLSRAFKTWDKRLSKAVSELGLQPTWPPCEEGKNV